MVIMFICISATQIELSSIPENTINIIYPRTNQRLSKANSGTVWSLRPVVVYPAMGARFTDLPSLRPSYCCQSIPSRGNITSRGLSSKLRVCLHGDIKPIEQHPAM